MKLYAFEKPAYPSARDIKSWPNPACQFLASGTASEIVFRLFLCMTRGSLCLLTDLAILFRDVFSTLFGICLGGIVVANENPVRLSKEIFGEIAAKPSVIFLGIVWYYLLK